SARQDAPHIASKPKADFFRRPFFWVPGRPYQCRVGRSRFGEPPTTAGPSILTTTTSAMTRGDVDGADERPESRGRRSLTPTRDVTIADVACPVVTAPCGCLVLDDEWCRTCGGCRPRGAEWAGCCRCGVVTPDATDGGRS